MRILKEPPQPSHVNPVLLSDNHEDDTSKQVIVAASNHPFMPRITIIIIIITPC